MEILDIIYKAYPELENADLMTLGIFLQDDSDGLGIWVVKWDYTKPLPAGLKLGK